MSSGTLIDAVLSWAKKWEFNWGMSFGISSVKKYCPSILWGCARFLYAKISFFIKMRWTLFTWERHTRRGISRIKKKGQATILFLPANVAMWKYDVLFRKLQEHSKFTPVILPSVARSISDEEKIAEKEKMIRYFKSRGFPVVSEQEARALKPDIVFITQAYGRFAEYDLSDFPDALGCYSPYSYPTCFDKRILNLINLNKVWRLFDTTEEHRTDLSRLMSNHGKNVRVTGYTNADLFLASADRFKFPWKQKNPRLKRIIYAPHWTIGDRDVLGYATFLVFGEVMLNLAKKYTAYTQWCFKPHPWLFRALSSHPDWGAKRAKSYFNAWQDLPNAMIVTDDYVSLFMTSDAMIHDCGSFRCEYFYAKKPAMYLVKDGQLENDGEIGRIAFEAHSHGRTSKDIEAFIERIISGEDDSKKEARGRFFDKYLLPPNEKSAAENILEEMERGLGWRN